ncbi:MAG: hypothetical protein A3J38_03485 [Gammaproteobacteria bacterium RIFCSPHIGHO2_12_FULL_45_9]|nr:MAG: hypothetical protein A3J38_03485 [Gammaproteobacteria bacterium RIFCSPHIGHO2_12_FULL_45_9]
MRRYLPVSSLLCVAGFSGCAALLSGTSQSVQIETVDNQTATFVPVQSCRITHTEEGTTLIPHGRGIVTIKRGDQPTILCPKPGYEQLATQIPTSINPFMWLDVLFWPSFIVDIATGAYQKYPAYYPVQMHRKDG